MLDRVEWLKARGRRRERGEFRASDADREDAYRRLEVHQTMGHIDEEARLRIRAAVEVAETPNEITKVFVAEGLPELPARSPSTERRVSAQDRAAAIGLLEKAFAESRITADECAEATDRVSKARTRSEVDAAFHGLSTPSRVAVEKAAANVAEKTAKLSTPALGEGGRRAQELDVERPAVFLRIGLDGASGRFGLLAGAGVEKHPRSVAADDDAVVEGSAHVVLELLGIEALG